MSFCIILYQSEIQQSTFFPRSSTKLCEEPLFKIIDSFDREIFSNVIVLTNRHFHAMIANYLRLFGPKDIAIECRLSPSDDLSTAIKSLKLPKTFCLHYSDIVIDKEIDWKKILSDHRLRIQEDKDIIGTLITTQFYKLPVGIVTPSNNEDEPDIIEKFVEKPRQQIGVYINTAIAILEPEYICFMQENEENLFQGSIERAKEARKKVRFHLISGFNHVQTLSDWTRIQNEKLAK